MGVGRDCVWDDQLSKSKLRIFDNLLRINVNVLNVQNGFLKLFKDNFSNSILSFFKWKFVCSK